MKTFIHPLKMVSFFKKATASLSDTTPLLPPCRARSRQGIRTSDKKKVLVSFHGQTFFYSILLGSVLFPLGCRSIPDAELNRRGYGEYTVETEKQWEQTIVPHGTYPAATQPTPPKKKNFPFFTNLFNGQSRSSQKSSPSPSELFPENKFFPVEHYMRESSSETSRVDSTKPSENQEALSLVSLKPQNEPTFSQADLAPLPSERRDRNNEFNTESSSTQSLKRIASFDGSLSNEAASHDLDSVTRRLALARPTTSPSDSSPEFLEANLLVQQTFQNAKSGSATSLPPLENPILCVHADSVCDVIERYNHQNPLNQTYKQAEPLPSNNQEIQLVRAETSMSTQSPIKPATGEISALPNLASTTQTSQPNQQGNPAQLTPSNISNQPPQPSQQNQTVQSNQFAQLKQLISSPTPESAEVTSDCVVPASNPVPNSVDSVAQEAASLAPSQASSDPSPSQPTWQHETEQAIELLKQELEAKRGQGVATNQEEVRLQLLHVTLGLDANNANLLSQPPENMTAFHQFWQNEFQGLSLLLNSDLNNLADEKESLTPAQQDQTVQAVQQLQNGLDALTARCPVQIRKAIFVENTAQYGFFKEKAALYHPGQTLFVYTELDHVQSQICDNQHQISVDCSWELVDQTGLVILPVTHQHCLNQSASRLRDIVLNISLKLPEDLPAGSYRLNLSVADQNQEGTSATQTILPLTIQTP